MSGARHEEIGEQLKHTDVYIITCVTNGCDFFPSVFQWHLLQVLANTIFVLQLCMMVACFLVPR